MATPPLLPVCGNIKAAFLLHMNCMGGGERGGEGGKEAQWTNIGVEKMYFSRRFLTSKTLYNFLPFSFSSAPMSLINVVLPR